MKIKIKRLLSVCSIVLSAGLLYTSSSWAWLEGDYGSATCSYDIQHPVLGTTRVYEQFICCEKPVDYWADTRRWVKTNTYTSASGKPSSDTTCPDGWRYKKHCDKDEAIKGSNDQPLTSYCGGYRWLEFDE